MHDDYLANFTHLLAGEETPEVRHRREYYELQELERAEEQLKDAQSRIERLVSSLNLR